MKKVFIVFCVLAILIMGSMGVYADPEAEPGTEITVSPNIPASMSMDGTIY